MRYVCILLLLAACRDVDDRPSDWQKDTAQSVINTLVYVEDRVTGLCFAVHIGRGGNQFALVPCEAAKLRASGDTAP